LLPIDEKVLEALLHSGFRYALSLTHDRAQAEDILQDAWLAVLQAKGPHERPYLFCAIRTRFLNLNKRENLVVVVNLDDVSSQEWASVSDDLDFVDFHHLEKALTCLRSIEREALFLMTVEGYTAKEVAAFTGQARGTVLSHIHRAKHKLRQFFNTHNIEVRCEK